MIDNWFRVMSEAATRDVPKNFTEFTEKHLCQSPFLNKVAGLTPSRPATLLKKETLAQVFSCEFCENS